MTRAAGWTGPVATGERAVLGLRASPRARRPVSTRAGRAVVCLLACTFLLSPRSSWAQDTSPFSAPIVDSVEVSANNVFSEEEARESFVYRLVNAVRFPTRRGVVARELLFRAGEPYDSVLVQETERNLRSLSLFREVAIDTVRNDGRLITRVQTWDAWSTKVTFTLNVGSKGRWTGRFGVTETNVLGTGNLLHAAYRREVDRDGFELLTQVNRLFDSHLDVGGGYFGLSDGDIGNWFIGDTWRSFQDPRAIIVSGEGAGRRILRYRVLGPERTDTTFLWRRAFVNRVSGAIATTARRNRYVRIGAHAEIRREEYIALADTGLAIPDTVKAVVGVFGEARNSRFLVLRYLNGFQEEDVDLSPRLAVRLNIAPSAFGYERTGIGPAVAMGAGAHLGSGFVQGLLAANGLFDSAGLDSGRVVLRATLVQQPAERHTTVVHLQAGIMHRPPPGAEFDLGFDVPPRSWDAHSFVGTRTVWLTFEQRWYALDRVFDLFGAGFAAFLDYGGAWYAGQDPRWGGDAGLGLRVGGLLGSTANTTRLDLGYRFGPEVTGDRWVVTLGTGFPFP